MAKYKKKPVIVEAVTFDEFKQIGLSQEGQDGVNIVDGEPWAFKYQGKPITQENSDCYIVPTIDGYADFTRNDVLITAVAGNIYPYNKELFDAEYDRIEE